MNKIRDILGEAWSILVQVVVAFFTILISLVTIGKLIKIGHKEDKQKI